MRVNWKLRLRNKATLAALVSAVVLAAYQVCAALGVTPPVEQDAVLEIAGLILTALTALGVVVDPTTPGVSDSEAALGRDDLTKGDSDEGGL